MLSQQTECLTSGAAEYTLCQFDTKLSMQLRAGGAVEMHFADLPGIRLKLHRKGGELEYDWVVKPHMNPDAIRVTFSGAAAPRIDADGDLVLQTGNGIVRQSQPKLYQDIGGVRHEVAGSFVLREAGQVGFRIGAYDPDEILVIDPTLSFSGGIGGSGSSFSFLGSFLTADSGTGISADGSGNMYIVGVVHSQDFPVTNALFRMRIRAAAFLPPKYHRTERRCSTQRSSREIRMGRACTLYRTHRHR